MEKQHKNSDDEKNKLPDVETDGKIQKKKKVDKTTPRREGCGWLIGNDVTYTKPK